MITSQSVSHVSLPVTLGIKLQLNHEFELLLEFVRKEMVDRGVEELILNGKLIPTGVRLLKFLISNKEHLKSKFLL